MKLFNKLFKQQPEQTTQTVSLKESEARWQAMHDQNMADLASQGVKKRDLYGWS
ncbi:hypothetical protein [Streptococcus hyovaginalis]|uniref:hypothetical protein n=1 Tax=Streptococcus hyovaginalis TaxID=149015 RepID=UPI003BF887F9